MGKHKSNLDTIKEIYPEIASLKNKGYEPIFFDTTKQKDKRRFTKIFDIKLNNLIFKTNIDRKYINFFILLVNVNSKYIEPDLNLINLSIKQVAENMQYTTVYIYNCLKVLKKENIIDYYKKGKSNFIVINPCYYARFYDIKYMYFLDNAFNDNSMDITEIIDRIIVLKNCKNDKKNKNIESEIKEYIKENCLQD